MLPVNIDLLKTTTHHPDGRRREPHSQYAAEARAAAQGRLRASLAKFLRRLAEKIEPSPNLPALARAD